MRALSHAAVRRGPIRLALLAAVLASGGCFHYAPLAAADLQPGRQVRAELGDQGTAELARWIGPRGVSLQGRLQSVSDSTVTLQLSEVVRRNGVTEPWVGETVVVPRPYVASFGERRFDRKRTALVGLGAVVALLGVDAILGEAGFVFRGRGGNGSGARQ